MAGERSQRNARAQEPRHEPQAARLPPLEGKAGCRGLTGNLGCTPPSGGLAALAVRLRAHGVTAAAMEGTGIYWEAPFDALAEAGIKPMPARARQVKKINS